MSTILRAAMRPVLNAFSIAALSACAATPQSKSMNHPMTEESSMTVSMMGEMSCACCAKMKEAKGGSGCCKDMKESCSCCAGMVKDGKGMMCAPKTGARISAMDHSIMNHEKNVNVYSAATQTMHENMSMEPTGNADTDFMRGMIPHHQGAIDMAKLVLAHGKDPEVRKLAEAVIKAQDEEITFMRAWLAKNAQ